jgi:hypothetical protein
LADKPGKSGIITFKADAAMSAAMQGVPNRSAFIRAAILAALDNTCPLCAGRGTLSPNQKRHWQALAQDHSVRTCGKCNERRLVCARGRSARRRVGRGRARRR